MHFKHQMRHLFLQYVAENFFKNVIYTFSGMLVVHYLQAITPQLAMGSELLFQRAKHRQQAMITLAGRYQSILLKCYAFYEVIA